MNVKICVDCKFYMGSLGGDRCIHPSVLGSKSIVTGRQSTKSCTSCRADVLYGCGPDGVNFKKTTFLEIPSMKTYDFSANDRRMSFVRFSDDGLTLLMFGKDTNTMYEYKLTKPFDIETIYQD